MFKNSISKAVFFTLLAALCLASVHALETELPEDASETEPAEGEHEISSKREKVYHVVLTGLINEASALWVKEGIQEAIDAGADTVILEMDTPGGTVQASQDLADFIFSDVGIEVVTYVNTQALSGGTMVALACNSIYMDKNVGMIGDVAPVTPTGEMLPEKVQTVIREILSNYARHRGYPIALVQAMVTPEYAVYRIRTEGEEEYEFFRDVDMETWSEEKKDSIVSQELIVARGELLTLSTNQAVDYGLAVKGVTSRLHLFDELGVEPGQVKRIYLTLTQRLLTFLNTMSPLFLIAGLILLYMELNEPGLGIPGILGVICLATFFLVKFSLQYAEFFEIILFSIGLALLMVELFIIPGFGFVGAGGIFLIFVSLVLMLQQFRLPASPSEFRAFQFNLLEVTGVFLAVVFGMVLIARYLGKIPFFNKLIRTDNLANAYAYAGGAAQAGMKAEDGSDAGSQVPDMIGAFGVAITPLHPSGKAEFDEEQHDVVAEGRYVEKGAKIEVIAKHGQRLLVRRGEEQSE